MANVPSFVYNAPYINSLGIVVSLPNTGGRVRRPLMTPFNLRPSYLTLDRPIIGQIWPRGLCSGDNDVTAFQLPTGVEVFRATNFTLADATPTAVVFSNEVIDDANYWDSGNPTRITIANAGWYSVIGQASIDGTVGGAWEVSIRLNGATKVTKQSAPLDVGPDSLLAVQAGAILNLAVNDFLELVVETNTDTGLTQEIVGGNHNTFLQLVRLV